MIPESSMCLRSGIDIFHGFKKCESYGEAKMQHGVNLTKYMELSQIIWEETSSEAPPKHMHISNVI